MFKITAIVSFFSFMLLAGIGVSIAQEQHKRVTTPDGYVFDYVKSDDEDRVTIGVAWPSNSIFDDNLNPVIPHLAAQLMVSGGTTSIPPADLLAKFEELNASAQIFPQPGYVRGTLSFNLAKIEDAVALSNLVLIEPSMDDKWLQRNKRNLIGHIEETNLRADAMAGNIARRILFSQTPIEAYWSTPLELVENISNDDVVKWHQQHFGSENAIISVSANEYNEVFPEIIDRLFDQLPNSDTQIVNPGTYFALPNKTIALVDADVTNAQVLILGEIPNSKQGLGIETLIALNALGQSASSRLLNVVRDEQRATYSFSSGMIDFVRDHRVMALAGAIDPASLQAVLGRIDDVYETFRLDGLEQAEFSAIQDQFAEGMKNNLKKSAILANAVLEARIDGTDIQTVLDLPDDVAAMTLEQQNQFLAKHFPAYSSMLKIVVVPNAGTIDADCVIASIDELAACELD